MRWLLIIGLVVTGGLAWGQGRPIVPQDVGIQTPFSAVGDLLVAGPSTSQIQDSAAVSSIKVPKPLNYSNNITMTAPFVVGNTWLNIDGNAIFGTAGTPADGNISPFRIYIGGDSVDTTTSGNGVLTAFAVTHATSGGSTGYRTAIQGSENIVGTPVGNNNYVGVLGITRGSANLNGTAGSYNNSQGGAFGMNSNVFLTSGATFVAVLTSLEADVAIQTGASAAEKHGLAVVITNPDVSRALYDDSAVEFDNQDGTSTTWKYGISFGAYAHKWAFGTDSTLIGAQQRQVGPGSPDSPVALWGIDFSKVTFQAGGGFLKSTGFTVDPSGKVNLASAGSTSVPTLAFTNCGANCGWYAPAASQIGLVIGGTLAMDNGITRAGWSFFGQVVGDFGFVVSGNSGSVGLRGGTTAISSPASGVLQLGYADAAAPAAQSLQAQSVVAGTINTAGQNWVFNGSLSTGSGVSGDIIFKTGGTGAGATAQNAEVTALTIKGATQSVQLPVVTTGTPTASLCLDAGGNIIKKTTAGSCI